MNTGIDQILAKKAEKVAAVEERRKERADKGEVNHLLIQRTPTGLYQCRYEKGPLPDELKCMFTQKRFIVDICKRRDIAWKEVH
jgi:hypothetical protein